MAFRADLTPMGKVEETPQGGLRIPATITRTGIFEYATDDGGVVKEYRPPEEVERSLASFNNAPVTNDHPPEHVHPGNFGKYAKGHVEPGVKMDGDKAGAHLIVQDGGLIKDIRDGKREVSSGYHCDLDETPGCLSTGERYDRVQKNIRGNHVAIVTTGRAGPSVRLRLDSAGDQITHTKGADHMKIEVIDGVEYEVGSSGHRDACQRRDAKNAEIKARLDEADKAKADAVKARADAADEKAKREKADAALKEATSAEALDKRVRLREAVITTARHHLGGDFKVDGLSNDEIKRAAIKKALPHIKADKLDHGELRGAFLTLIPKKGERRVDGIDRLRVPVTPIPPGGRMDATDHGRSTSQIRLDAQVDSDLRSTRPLALSKDSPFKEQSNHPMLQSGMMENQR